MKEDDQEVLSLLPSYQEVLSLWELKKIAEKFDFFHTVKKRKLLYLESGAVKDRKILGGLVQGPFCPISNLPSTKTASARRWALTLNYIIITWYSNIYMKRSMIGSFDGFSGHVPLVWMNTNNSSFILQLTAQFHPCLNPCTGVDRLDKDLTIGQMQGKKHKQTKEEILCILTHFFLFVTNGINTETSKICIISLFGHRKVSDAGPPSVWSCCPWGRTWKSKGCLSECTLCPVCIFL